MGRYLAALFLLAACGDSSPWVEQEVPSPGANAGSTYTLWVFAEDDVWLGGSSTWNFDGSSWTEVPLPVADAYVVKFWGFAPDELWAMSSDRVFRWNGSQWSELPPAEDAPFEALWAIWGSSPTDVWIANTDNSKVYHYDGDTWTRQTLQFVMAEGLWGSSPTDIWLTGPFDTYHYDGVSWTIYQAPDFGPQPAGAYAIWGSASDDVWASEFDFLHWDGDTWSEVEAEATYNSMWGFGPDDIYAVGNRGTMAHWNGSAWNETSGHLNQQQNFTQIHGSSPDNLWATAVDFNTLSGMVLRLR